MSIVDLIFPCIMRVKRLSTIICTYLKKQSTMILAMRANHEFLVMGVGHGFSFVLVDYHSKGWEE